MRRGALLAGGIFFLALLVPVHTARAQELIQDTVTFVTAEVTDVLSSELREIPATGTKTSYQTIRVKLLDGEHAGERLILDNDYLSLKKGEKVVLRHTVNAREGKDQYAVLEPYRLPVLWFLLGLFVLCLVLFGGVQGVRGLMALCASLFFILYLLLPGILAGYPPMFVSLSIAAIIVVFGSYITHGFNRATTAAVFGMLVSIVVTGVLAYLSIYAAQLSGYSSDEAVYLNFNTKGTIDFVGLLLGSVMIGLLGVLYDAAISQAIAVEELCAVGAQASRKEIFSRALRIGREHIGALVNTLAIAYVGASLPLILLVKQVTAADVSVTLNQELFATEIVRTIVSSIGIILAVPITTAVSVWMLYGKPTRRTHTHHH